MWSLSVKSREFPTTTEQCLRFNFKVCHAFKANAGFKILHNKSRAWWRVLQIDTRDEHIAVQNKWPPPNTTQGCPGHHQTTNIHSNQGNQSDIHSNHGNILRRRTGPEPSWTKDPLQTSFFLVLGRPSRISYANLRFPCRRTHFLPAII